MTSIDFSIMTPNICFTRLNAHDGVMKSIFYMLMTIFRRWNLFFFTAFLRYIEATAAYSTDAFVYALFADYLSKCLHDIASQGEWYTRDCCT